ncbi:MAG: hypothetical protein V6S10_01890 [Candidatus Methanoglobus sp.]
MREDEFIERGGLLTVFITLVILGCIILPALDVLLLLQGSNWIPITGLTLVLLIPAVIIARSIERYLRGESFRSRIYSKRRWMSLADFGASYGRIARRRGTKGDIFGEKEDHWSFLRKL